MKVRLMFTFLTLFAVDIFHSISARERNYKVGSALQRQLH